MTLLEQFIELLYSQVDRAIYVWGGDGQILDDMDKPREWIERHESSPTDASRAIKLYNKRIAAGLTDIRAFDCSGLVYWALHTLGLQKSDVSSRGLYNLSTHVEKKQLRAGDLVFHHNGVRIVHVGVWMSDASQIECRGRDYGVVVNKRSAGYWNRFGRWKAFDTEPTIVCVKGRSVNVRDADNKSGNVLGIAHRGDTYPLLGVAPSGWYNIDFNGTNGYISNRSDLTEVL